MGSVPPQLATRLRDSLGLERAVETGTYHGNTARILGGLFGEVVTIELSAELAERAAERLEDVPNVSVRQGDSRERLRELVAPDRPTLYFLDGHWSGGPTAGEQAECPVLDEVEVIGAGHSDDCVVIDDARLFAAAPPPPHDPAQWPTLVEVLDALRGIRPSHHVTVLRDLVIAVPERTRTDVDRFGRGELDPEQHEPAPEPLLRRATRRLRGV